MSRLLSEVTVATPQLSPAGVTKNGKGRAFWFSFTAILVSMFLSALDLTAMGTVLPTITKDLNGGDRFVWIGSAYALASTAVLPLLGALADAFGRRPVMLCSITLFAIGSALAGAAQNIDMMIAARSTNPFVMPVPNPRSCRPTSCSRPRRRWGP
jgi:predicted MFS family arabinose efflux permease